MVDGSVDEMLAELLTKAETLGIDVSSLVADGDTSDDAKRDACIRLLRAMFEVMRQAVSETSEELEHMYDACYQTFHDTLEPARNIWKLSGLMVNDQTAERPLDPRYAEVINSSSHFLVMMFDDLMNLTVLRRRRGELRERFSLTMAVDQAVEHLFSNIRERNAVVEVVSDLPEVISNRSRWTRIFQNVIKNGIIYNRSDRPTITISYVDGVISVSDNGMGIREADIERIFGLFTRLRDRRHMAEGTGSGLYQVRRLLSDDHATIEAVSNADEGSTFHIDIRGLLRSGHPASP